MIPPDKREEWVVRQARERPAAERGVFLDEASLEAARRLAPGSPEALMAQGAFEYRWNNDWAKALVHFHADEPVAYYRGREWSVRQQPVVQLEIARALANRKEGALREAQAALVAQRKLDPYTLAFMRFGMGQVLIVCDRREEAFAALREWLGGGGLETPARIQRDPFWSRLKDDPRFEEILKSAKPFLAPISNGANEEPGK